MLKRIAFYIASAAYLFVSSFLFPVHLLTAFNYNKGIQLNEDGFMFIPVGFLLIIVSVVIAVLLFVKAWKMSGKSILGKCLIVGISLVICAVSVHLTLIDWKLFFECLAHFKGLNLSPQFPR